MNATLEHLESIIYSDEFRTWPVNTLCEKLFERGVDVKPKTVRNHLGSHPTIEPKKKGSLVNSPVIGYRVIQAPRGQSYKLAWETFKDSFNTWPYPLVFGVVVGIGYLIFNSIY